MPQDLKALVEMLLVEVKALAARVAKLEKQVAGITRKAHGLAR